MQLYLHYIILYDYIYVVDRIQKCKGYRNEKMNYFYLKICVCFMFWWETQRHGEQRRREPSVKGSERTYCSSWFSPSIFVLRQSLSWYFCHWDAYGSVWPILLYMPPRTPVEVKILGLGLQVWVTVHNTAFLLGPGDQTQVSRRSVQ